MDRRAVAGWATLVALCATVGGFAVAYEAGATTASLLLACLALAVLAAVVDMAFDGVF